MILHPVLRYSGPRQRIFRREEGRGEVIISLGDENPHPAILAHRLAEIGGDVEIGVAVAPADPPVPVAADAPDRLIFAVGDEAEAAPRPGVDRRGIAGVDAVEAG